MKRENYISDEAVVKRAKEAVRIELEKLKAMDIPVVIYDRVVFVETNCKAGVLTHRQWYYMQV